MSASNFNCEFISCKVLSEKLEKIIVLDCRKFDQINEKRIQNSHMLFQNNILLRRLKSKENTELFTGLFFDSLENIVVNKEHSFVLYDYETCKENELNVDSPIKIIYDHIKRKYHNNECKILEGSNENYIYKKFSSTLKHIF